MFQDKINSALNKLLLIVEELPSSLHLILNLGSNEFVTEAKLSKSLSINNQVLKLMIEAREIRELISPVPNSKEKPNFKTTENFLKITEAKKNKLNKLILKNEQHLSQLKESNPDLYAYSLFATKRIEAFTQSLGELLSSVKIMYDN